MCFFPPSRIFFTGVVPRCTWFLLLLLLLTRVFVTLWVCVCVLPQNKYGAFERAKPILGSSQLRMQNIFPNVFSECCRLGCRRNRKTLRPTPSPPPLFVHLCSWIHREGTAKLLVGWFVTKIYSTLHTPHAKLYSVPGAFFVPALTIVFSPMVWLVFILRSESVYFGSGLFFFFQEHSVHVFSDS